MKLIELFEAKILGYRTQTELEPGTEIVYPPVGENVVLTVRGTFNRGSNPYTVAIHEPTGREFRIDPSLARIVPGKPQSLDKKWNRIVKQD